MSDGKTNSLKNAYRWWFYRWLIRKYFDDCKTILDVGAGKGLFVHVAQCAGKNVEGIDRNPGSAIGVQRYADYKEWSLPIDAVFASQFIEHVDAQEFVAWANKVCEKKLVIITPRPTTDFWDDPEHIRPYTKTAIKELLVQNGWHILLNINLFPTSSHLTVAEKLSNG